MELGTADIFLDANRKADSNSTGVHFASQRYGNEGQWHNLNATHSDFAAVLKGQQLHTSTGRKAVVNVRPQLDGNGSRRARMLKSADPSLMSANHAAALSLEHRLSLLDLELLFPFFLRPKSPPPLTSALPSHSHVSFATDAPPLTTASSSSFAPLPPPAKATTTTTATASYSTFPRDNNSNSCSSTAAMALGSGSTILADRSRLRRITVDIFSDAMAQLALQHADQSAAAIDATAEDLYDEAGQLFQRVDAESRNTISWDELTAFLVSQHGASVQSNALSQQSELVPVSMPRSCAVWQQHEQNVCCIVASQRTGVVYTGGCDGTLRTWDPLTLKPLRLLYACSSWITGIILTHREQRLVVCTLDRQLIVLDAKTADVLRIYRGKPVLQSETGVAYAHETIPVVTVGGRVVSHAAPKGTRIRRVRRDDATSGKALSYEEHKQLIDEEKRLQPEKRRLEEFILAGMADSPCCLEYHFTRNDEDMLLFGMTTGTICLYVLPTSLQRVVRRHHVLPVHTARVRQLKVLAQIDALLSCSDDGTLKLTSLETGALLKSYGKHGDGHQLSVHCFDFHSTARMIVSTGGERCGFVWDYLQDSPVAKLDSHNCPAMSCFINEAESVIITIGMDNSILVFQFVSFQLLQSFHEAPRLESLHPTYTATFFDAARQRLLCATTFPVMHPTKKMAAKAKGSAAAASALLLATQSSASATTTTLSSMAGHTATVVGVLVNYSQQLLLSFDMDLVCMAWSLRTGECVLSFSLSTFKYSMATELRLHSFALDPQERRVLTGFHNGVAVVWNMFNGQALSIVQAAPLGEPIGAGTQVSSVGAVAPPSTGETHYAYAAGNDLVSVLDTAFTITDPPRWRVPEEFGSVCVVAPCTPHVMTCGTTKGALLFFHIVSCSQDGRALWLSQEAETPLNRATTTMTTTRRSKDFSSPIPPKKEGAGKKESHHQQQPQQNAVKQILPLPHIAGGTHFMVLYADNRLALWHSRRRALLSVIDLNHVSQGVVMCVAVDPTEAHRYLAFGDDHGNVTVVELDYRPHPRHRELDAHFRAIEPLGSPTKILPHSAAAKAAPQTSSSSQQQPPQPTTTAASSSFLEHPPSAEAATTDASLPTTTLDCSIRRVVSCFHTGCPMVSTLALVPQERNNNIHHHRHGDEEGEEDEDDEGGAEPPAAASVQIDGLELSARGPPLQRLNTCQFEDTQQLQAGRPLTNPSRKHHSSTTTTATASPRPPVVAPLSTTTNSNGAFNSGVFTSEQQQQQQRAEGLMMTMMSLFVVTTANTETCPRVFTFDGVPIGELGRSRWQLFDSSTYRNGTKPEYQRPLSPVLNMGAAIDEGTVSFALGWGPGGGGEERGLLLSSPRNGAEEGATMLLSMRSTMMHHPAGGGDSSGGSMMTTTMHGSSPPPSAKQANQIGNLPASNAAPVVVGVHLPAEPNLPLELLARQQQQIVQQQQLVGGGAPPPAAAPNHQYFHHAQPTPQVPPSHWLHEDVWNPAKAIGLSTRPLTSSSSTSAPAAEGVIVRTESATTTTTATTKRALPPSRQSLGGGGGGGGGEPPLSSSRQARRQRILRPDAFPAPTTDPAAASMFTLHTPTHNDQMFALHSPHPPSSAAVDVQVPLAWTSARGGSGVFQPQPSIMPQLPIPTVPSMLQVPSSAAANLLHGANNNNNNNSNLGAMPRSTTPRLSNASLFVSSPSLLLTAPAVGAGGARTPVRSNSTASSSSHTQRHPSLGSPTGGPPLPLQQLGGGGPVLPSQQQQQSVGSRQLSDPNARRTALLTTHLDTQLQRLRDCKGQSALTAELQRVSQRLARSLDGGSSGGGSSTQRDSAVFEDHSSSSHSANKGAWTTRIASRMQLHELSEVAPPQGSRASAEFSSRRHNTQLSKSSGGMKATDLLPSVTAPGVFGGR